MNLIFKELVFFDILINVYRKRAALLHGIACIEFPSFSSACCGNPVFRFMPTGQMRLRDLPEGTMLIIFVHDCVFSQHSLEAVWTLKLAEVGGAVKAGPVVQAGLCIICWELLCCFNPSVVLNQYIGRDLVVQD